MSISVSLRFSPEAAIVKSHTSVDQSKHLKVKNHANIQTIHLSSRFMPKDYLNLQLSSKENWPLIFVSHRYKTFVCQSFTRPGGANVLPIVKSTSLALSRSYDAFRGCPLTLQLVTAVGFITFSVWALGLLLRYSRSFFLHKDNNWKMSQTHSIFTAYLQPLLLWTGIIFICRALDVVVLSTEASQVVKQRFLNFIRSLSTVLAFAYCLSSLIPQMQKLIHSNESSDAQKMGVQFASKAMYTAIWVAAFSLFMELLGFSTQKWLTAGGFGTVLLTLAGREIFTNFLSSLMIHATRPFVLNEWIQTKIEGYEVSGTVERVGWWSPTIIRGDDREAVHIPNHKFTVNIVRNLSQKTHWRVKTHIAISHFDAHKISNIVADMRKVLAKNPQVEQQKLHRRVFLDYIEPENQAFMILVSCFVKTSHFEEYLCVKEAILLDLLRVISHHKARLATPIRTLQKFYNNENLANAPFADTINTARSARGSRPLYLIEATSRMNEDKLRSLSEPYINEEEALRNFHTSEKGTTDTELKEHHQDHSEKEKVPNSDDSPLESDVSLVGREIDDGKQQKVKSARTSNSSPESRSEGFDSMGQHNKKDRTVPRSSHEKPPSSSTSESAAERGKGGRTVSVRTKQKTESERARSGLEDNIVLGVALDGSKRTLPIHEDDIEPSPTESKMEK